MNITLLLSAVASSIQPLVSLFGVEQAVVSPAAISITVDLQWRRALVFWIVQETTVFWALGVAAVTPQ